RVVGLLLRELAHQDLQFLVAHPMAQTGDAGDEEAFARGKEDRQIVEEGADGAAPAVPVPRSLFDREDSITDLHAAKMTLRASAWQVRACQVIVILGHGSYVAGSARAAPGRGGAALGCHARGAAGAARAARRVVVGARRALVDPRGREADRA